VLRKVPRRKDFGDKKMNSISFVIMICAVIAVRGSLEQIKEQAWLEQQAQDKFLEYSGELVVPAEVDVNSVEVVQTTQKVPKVRLDE
jgi:hypothetical protein